MDAIETIKKGHTVIEIYPDEDMMESPREWDNLGTMVCFHSRYTLGDEHNFTRFVLDEKFYPDSPKGIHEFLEDTDPIELPLYLYDHSGITMNTTGFYCPWDSGQIGYIYVSREKVRKEYGWKYITKKREEQIKEYLRNEVKTYDQYLTGDVYGYNVKCEKCEEVLDSCWGFYGSNWEENGLLEYAHVESPCPICDVSGLLH